MKELIRLLPVIAIVLAGCYYDNEEELYPTSENGTTACDTVGITRSCTKYNWLVKSVDDLPRILHETFRVAQTGRPSSVFVDIPNPFYPFSRKTV